MMSYLLFEEKKQQGLTLIEFIILIIIGAVVFIIMDASYCNGLTRHNWSKAIATTSHLKLAIDKCLILSEGNTSVCNDFTENKLGKYAVFAPPKADNVQLISVTKDAGIKILGLDNLGMCILTITPSVNKTNGMIHWKTTMQSGGKASIEECRTYVKGSS